MYTVRNAYIYTLCALLGSSVFRCLCTLVVVPPANATVSIR